ncbi:ABC transporter permease [Cupriavidus sp. PET2-C1]
MAWLRKWPASAWVCLALFVACVIAVPRFGTSGNIFNLARVLAVLLLVAIGQGLVIVVRGLDFSVGSGVALFSVVAVLSMPAIGVGGAFAAGALAVLALGALNGTLVGVLRIPAFLATLGTMIAVHGLCGVLVGGVPLDAPTSVDFSALGRGQWLGLPLPLWLAGAALLVVGALTRYTAPGREWYLVGSNPEAAHLAGIAVKPRVLQAYLANAVLVAIAGAVLTSRLGSGQPNLYPNLPFEAIAACAIGGIPLTGGKGGPLHALFGCLILAMVGNALVLVNFPSYIQSVLLGVLILAAVLLQQLRGRSLRARPLPSLPANAS